VKQLVSVLAGIVIGVVATGAAFLFDLVDEEGSVSVGFCEETEAWYVGQADFLAQTNQPNAATPEGEAATEAKFQASARLPLPEADNDPEEDLRELLFAVVRAEEEWLSSLTTIDLALNLPGITAIQQVDVFRSEEERRIEMNDLLRRASAELAGACHFEPLPVYGS
jgi:hypothetical protein